MEDEPLMMKKGSKENLVQSLVDSMDPVTLWRWVQAIDERLKRDNGQGFNY